MRTVIKGPLSIAPFVVDEYVRRYYWRYGTERDSRSAEIELLTRLRRATYQDTDAKGRQLWHSGKPDTLNWILASKEKPEVIWFGRKLPKGLWEPRPDEE